MQSGTRRDTEAKERDSERDCMEGQLEENRESRRLLGAAECDFWKRR